MTLEKIVNYAKLTGYIYQGSEIYGGLSNTWDYGPLGSLLKQNLKDAWLKRFVTESPYNVLLDSSILLNKTVWDASGHLSGFSDPLTECRNCHTRHRADHLIASYDKTLNVDELSKEELYQILTTKKIKCPVCGQSDWTEIRQFNLMFKTNQGPVESDLNTVYLRPETAQGIFINFKNILRTTRKKIPFGVCQIGKAFRNEITPGNFIFRTREFEQMELEFFCQPTTELKWFDYWLEEMKSFLFDLGITEQNIDYHQHSEKELSHYSNKTIDILYRFPWGFDELWGIASRTDYDLKAHQEKSGQALDYLDPETNQNYIPYVVEPSLGVERLLLAVLLEGYREEKLSDGKTRTLLKIHPFLAPYKVAVLPLIRNKHQEKSEEVFKQLAKHFPTVYDETQTIGRRYRRQDQIGTPFAVTIDDETLINNTVTVRERDSMAQVRLEIEPAIEYIKARIKF
ncbi:MAG: glycine--tRNA ligase [Acholeplasmataceae bacterium]|jgi:glycyl-tRNA synthetase|nr:glycine--tRNA ligase [Acholeplasmataceae bacterium]